MKNFTVTFHLTFEKIDETKSAIYSTGPEERQMMSIEGPESLTRDEVISLATNLMRCQLKDRIKETNYGYILENVEIIEGDYRYVLEDVEVEEMDGITSEINIE